MTIYRTPDYCLGVEREALAPNGQPYLDVYLGFIRWVCNCACQHDFDEPECLAHGTWHQE